MLIELHVRVIVWMVQIKGHDQASTLHIFITSCRVNLAPPFYMIWTVARPRARGI